jgi:hypothetical protein
MKITLWQQFSSNHSASFTVVGLFEAPEKAEAMAALIRDIVEQIGNDYRAQIPDYENYFNWSDEIYIQALSPLEERIRKQHKITRKVWSTPLDWTYFPVTIHVFRNLLFVSGGGGDQSWGVHDPLNSLIKKAGGKAFSAADLSKVNYLTITCQAKDLESAKNIVANIAQVEVGVHDESYNYVRIPETNFRFMCELERKSLQLFFKNIQPYATTGSDLAHVDTATQLGFLIPYLESQGCSKIQYKFKVS